MATWWTAGALSLAALAVAGSLASGQDAELQSLRQTGQARFEEKQYGEAESAFAAVTARAEATPQDWLNLALARYKNNDHDNALVALDGAGTAEGAAAAGIHFLRGLIFKQRGEADAALPELLRAADVDPSEAAIRFNLGTVYDQLDDTDSAVREYRAVIDMGFDIALQYYVSAVYRYFQVLQLDGRREEAARWVDEYRQYRARLSQAQTSQSALEASVYTAVVVPRANLLPPRPETAGALRFSTTPIEAGVDGHVVVGSVDAAGPPSVLTTGPGGWVRRPDGTFQPLETPSGPAALGDFDRDGVADLYVASVDGDRLFRNVPVAEASGPARSSGVFEPVDVEGLPRGGDPRQVEWVDADHDGDLDVLIAHGAAGGPGLRLVENLGGGTFEEVTARAEIDAGIATRGVLWADFDDDNDVDFYAIREGAPNALYTNLRSGRFADIAAAVGADGGGATLAAVAEDMDNDGAIDLVLASPEGLQGFRNKGDGTFLPAGELAAGGEFSWLAADDFNNDGHLDLVAASAAGLRVLVNAGDWTFIAATASVAGADARPVAVADADGNGAADVLVHDAGGLAWATQLASPGRHLTVRLQGIKNNILGVGSTVEVKGGGLYQLRPVRDGAVRFGVGEIERLDVVRITWPNGIIQNEIDVATDRSLGPVVELERLEGSCPLLYTWDGTGWRFINEVLGVAPLGMPLAEDVIHPADFDEYVPVPGEAMVSRDGMFEVRLTEELREAGYLDAVRLLAVDHPVGTRVIPDEKFVAPPHPELRLFVVADPRPVLAADQGGHDVTAELADVDGRWPRPFEPHLYDGLATPHAIELSLPEAEGAKRSRLFLTGWVYWATGSINLAVDDDPRVAFEPVSLQVPDGHGGWRTAIEDIGLPNAKNSTIAVDVAPHLLAGDPRVRVATTMRLYWDAAFYTVGGRHPEGLLPTGDWRGAWGVPHGGPMELVDPTAPEREIDVRVHVLEPAAADLRFRGFSTLLRTSDGFETFDYARPVATAPWNQHAGSYTRYGAVGELVDAAEDRFVVLGTGDEVAIRFADELPPVDPGWRRDYLVYLNGWVKDGDPNTGHGDRVEPLPFHAMTTYPYGSAEGYPETPEHRAYLLEYNTRPARKINPPLRPR